jgi:hypothetical protein
MRLAAVLCLFLATSCADGNQRLRNVTQPSAGPPAAPPAPPPAPVDRAIRIGEEVKDTLIGHGSRRVYALTAPVDGLLVAQLSWDTKDGYLELWLEDTAFVRSSSPTIGRLQVFAGQTYHVGVFDSVPWDYDDLVVPFVLTTSIE